MKICTACKTSRPFAHFSTRKASRDGLAYKCRGCAQEYQKANAERRRVVRRAWHEANLQSEQAKARNYYLENRERCMARHAMYKIAHAAEFAEYEKKTRAQYAARTAKYRASVSQRTPSWLTPEDLKTIAGIYEESAKLQRETGVPHHVDHFYPLRGKTVSGLHVPLNLRALPAKENTSKGNRFHE